MSMGGVVPYEQKEVSAASTNHQSGFEMRPRTMEEAMKFCEIMSKSDLVPKDYKDKPGNIMVAIQMGAELGLTPIRALRCIAVINGRASLWGDDLLAMVLASPVCEYVDESASTDKAGVCKTKRKGCGELVTTFTLEDAKRAGLLGKAGTWQTNTSRMLKLRARGFGLRDTFADVLAGLVSAEEAMDLPKIEPEDPKTNILEASQPLTLKDKLKAKVENQDKGQGDGLDVQAAALTCQQACDWLALVQSVKEWAELMNAAQASPLTAAEIKTVKDHGELALRRLKGGK